MRPRRPLPKLDPDSPMGLALARREAARIDAEWIEMNPEPKHKGEPDEQAD